MVVKRQDHGDPRCHLLGCLREVRAFLLPLAPDKLCVHDPSLIHIDYTLAGLQEFQKLYTKLLPQHQVLFCIALEGNSMHPLESQSKLLPEYLVYQLILYQETMILLNSVLHHGGLVDDLLLPEKATSL